MLGEFLDTFPTPGIPELLCIATQGTLCGVGCRCHRVVMTRIIHHPQVEENGEAVVSDGTDLFERRGRRDGDGKHLNNALIVTRCQEPRCQPFHAVDWGARQD